MTFRKIDTVSAMDLFVQQVQELILSGEYRPGDMLPSVRELEEQTGITRPVIAAGFVKLETMGFVEVKPRVGTFVRDYRRTGSVETLNAIMRHHGKLREHEIESLMQIRTPLERLCVDMVIANATDGELDSLAPLLDQLEKAARREAPEETAEQVFRFHHELAVLSGNVLLPLLYHSFKTASISLWTMFGRDHTCKRLYENRRQMYRALLNRDVEDAMRTVPGEYPDSFRDYIWPLNRMGKRQE